ncbi:MAG: PilZ domain-containing protein [Phenylobacterium sp.]|nr:PilZ domain-containing protein [Phenylobacterium sp.]
MISKPAPNYMERRTEPRLSVSAPGRVMHGERMGLWADCIIKDMSPSGAKVELSHFYRLPPRFMLLHFQENVAFEVVLKWRRGDLAGMAFERRHEMATTDDPRLAPVVEAWRALQPGLAKRS